MSGKKRYYVPENMVPELVAEITRSQAKSKVFLNVEVVPYKGRKYEKGTMVVTVG